MMQVVGILVNRGEDCLQSSLYRGERYFEIDNLQETHRVDSAQHITPGFVHSCAHQCVRTVALGFLFKA